MAIKKIKKQVKTVEKEFKSKIATLVISAFGLVAALSWNEAILGVFKQYYTAGEELTAKIIYAFVVTIIAVIVTIRLSKWNGKKK